MIFKKFQGKIFGVEFHPKEQKALDEEINRQITKRHQEFTDDFDYMIMHILHEHFGFGLTRLERFHRLFIENNDELVEHYEMPDAGVYIAREEMNAIGCNIEKWNKERSE